MVVKCRNRLPHAVTPVQATHALKRLLGSHLIPHLLSLQYGLYVQLIPKPTFIRIQKLILCHMGGRLFGQHEAAEYERPHFSRALSTAPGAHANTLRVSYGYVRTYTRSWPIRPSLPTGQLGRLNARHA